MDPLQKELQHLQFLQLPPLKAGMAGSMAGSELFKDLELYRAEVLGAHKEDDVKVIFFNSVNLPKEVDEMKELVVRVRVARAWEGGLGEEVDKKLLACLLAFSMALSPELFLPFLLGCWDLALELEKWLIYSDFLNFYKHLRH